MTRPVDWNHRDEKWQKRRFLLSAFVRNKETITEKVYQFIDDLIKKDYQPPLGSLADVDWEVKKLYEEYD